MFGMFKKKAQVAPTTADRLAAVICTFHDSMMTAAALVGRYDALVETSSCTGLPCSA